MGLSARDRRIISAIEQDLTDEDPRWARRFARRRRRFERREQRARHPAGRILVAGVLCVAWFTLLCVAVAHHGPWPWIVLAPTFAALGTAALRLWFRARRYGTGFGRGIRGNPPGT